MKKMKVTLVWQILIGFALGILIGAYLYHYPEHRDGIIKNILQPAGDIFLKMMKMIVIPVVFCCMVLGIAGQGNKKSVGRVGLKTMIYFFCITTTAIIFGLLVGNIFKPGAGADLTLLRAGAVHLQTSAVESHGLASIITNIIPENIIEAMAQGKILSVLFFAVLFGMALNVMDERKKQPVIDLISGIVDAMFKLTNFIMAYSPIGVCAMIAVTISTFGFSSLLPLAKLVLVGYGAILFFAIVVLGTIARFFGINIFSLAKYIKDELILTYSSAASAAVIPRIIQKVEELGAPKSIAGFVVPIGYSFNLDGTSIFLGIATLFITQLYGIDLSISEQVMLVVTMVVTTKGAAGVPGFMFVILSATLSSAGLPLEGIAFIAGIYRIIDMCNSTMNVFGNALAPLVIAKWEQKSRRTENLTELA
ncbi:cation:dicarboxylate symporter family transporter [Winslowiella iniecta]|uniref:Sodium:dicarboxylate symporter n=1 Tax=Winslowiella iniecta TaxID=1560201 RepID=A0A0L7T4Z8_9GAMM|nr:cation:dicarboxylase symporter family transporter [Winslowiella iniecta]KOC90291.1 sodium:dicarboxylate symporter [Winslowiella iniecta]KOC94747.1 sodium:dicarboxylate symporter [Winslowiella iniecta]